MSGSGNQTKDEDVIVGCCAVILMIGVGMISVGTGIALGGSGGFLIGLGVALVVSMIFFVVVPFEKFKKWTGI